MAFDTVLRVAAAADVVAMHRVAKAAYTKYVSRIGRKPAPMVADFAGHVARGEAYVLESGGTIAGYIVTFPKQGGQFVENVALSPAYQGQGLGRRLLAFAEAEARRHRLARVFLYTNAKMTENLDFYPRLGYVETHRVHEDGFDRVYLAKELTSP